MKSETASMVPVPTKSPQKLAFFRNAGLALLLAMLFRPLNAEEPRFKTGQAFETALRTKVTWSCVGVPLADQLQDFEQQAEIAILRDRRLDPRSPITMSKSSVPRIQILRTIASSIPDGAISVTESLVTIGPAASVYRLPILIDRNNDQANMLRKKLEPVVFRKMVAKIDVSWDRLAEPRQIVLQSAKAVGVTISNPEAVPHDVWGKQGLPMMSFTDLATIVLNQFDTTLEFAADSATVTIVPINPQETFEYRHTVGSKLKSAVSSEWQSRFPSVDVKWTGSNALVSATLEQQGMLNAVITELTYTESSAEQAAPIGSIRTTKFQLKAERASVGQLIEYFRTNKVVIEVTDSDSAETKAILAEIIQLNEITDKKTGSEFFPLVFGKHFNKIEVLDDRVILSRD